MRMKKFLIFLTLIFLITTVNAVRLNETVRLFPSQYRAYYYDNTSADWVNIKINQSAVIFNGTYSISTWTYNPNITCIKNITIQNLTSIRKELSVSGGCVHLGNNITEDINMTMGNITRHFVYLDNNLIAGYNESNIFGRFNFTQNSSVVSSLVVKEDKILPEICCDYLEQSTIFRFTSAIIFVNASDINLNKTSGKVQVRKTNNERDNLTMTFVSGNKFKAIFSNTSEIGNYYVEMFWFSDLAGNINNKASDLVITVVESIGGEATPLGLGGVVLPQVIITNISISLSPERVDLFYIYPLVHRTFELPIKSNVKLKECSAKIFSCEINDTYVILRYDLEKRNTLLYNIEEIVTISDGITFAYLPVTLRVVNLYVYYPIQEIQTEWNVPLFVEYEDKKIVGLRWWWIIMIFGLIIYVNLAIRRIKVRTKEVIKYATK